MPEDLGMGLVFDRQALVAPFDGGTHVLTYRSEFSLRGRSVHLLLDRLVPLLDGTRTVETLTAGLDPERASMVVTLLDELIGRGVVRDGAPAPPEAGGTEATGPAEELLPLVESATDDPVAAVRQYLGRKAVVVGRGKFADAVAAAVDRAGLSDVVRTDALCQAPDAAIVFAVTDDPDEAAAEFRDGVPADVLVAQAVVTARTAWLVHATGRAGWTSVWRRLRAWGHRPARACRIDAQATAVLSAQLTRGAFLHAVRPVAQDQATVTSVDLGSFETRGHTYLWHPFDGPAGGRPGVAGQVDPKSFSRAAIGALGEDVGVMTKPSEDDFPQVPLRICRVRVCDPVGLAGAPADVMACATDFTTARHRAALKGFAVYSSRMVDPRRLSTADGRAMPTGGDFDAAVADLATGRISGFVRGFDLGDQERIVPVDARDVFPVLRGAEGSRCPGVAAGYDWTSAVDEGLLSCCREIVLDEAADGQPGRFEDLAGSGLPATADRTVALVRAIVQADVRMLGVRNALALPTVACLVDSSICLESGYTFADALDRALERALMQVQVSGPAVRDIELDPGSVPPSGRDPIAAIPYSGRGRLVAALARSGRRAIAVPLDHDRHVGRIMPYAVRVVVVDD